MNLKPEKIIQVSLESAPDSKTVIEKYTSDFKIWIFKLKYDLIEIAKFTLKKVKFGIIFIC